MPDSASSSLDPENVRASLWLLSQKVAGLSEEDRAQVAPALRRLSASLDPVLKLEQPVEAQEDPRTLVARETRALAARMETILNHLYEGVLFLEPSGHIQVANSYAIALLGFDPLRMHYSAAMTRLHITQDDGSALQSTRAYEHVLGGQMIVNQPLRLTNRRDREYHILVSAQPVYLQRELAGMVVVIKDVTELRQVEAERIAYEAHTEVQRRLLEHREMERQRIARDLHSGPVQVVVALLFGLQGLLMEDLPETMVTGLHEIQVGLQGLVTDLREVCNELRPPGLAQFGLAHAIQAHASKFGERNPSPRMALEFETDNRLLPETTRLGLFRIYQESLANIQRHAHASHVHVRLSAPPGAPLVLEIKDNGRGFVLPQDWVAHARSGHLGLVGMREQAEALRAALDIESDPGKGTTVRVILPELETL